MSVMLPLVNNVPVIQQAEIMLEDGRLVCPAVIDAFTNNYIMCK